MAYKDYTVRFTFTKDETGAIEYTFPLVFHVSDPKEGMKAVVIPGNRGDGSIVIPGGKKSQEITISGNILDEDGYKDITELINELKSGVTTDVGFLTMKHYDPDLTGGPDWVIDWIYTVRRITEIEFPESLRTDIQEYQVTFLVISY